MSTQLPKTSSWRALGGANFNLESRSAAASKEFRARIGVDVSDGLVGP